MALSHFVDSRAIAYGQIINGIFVDPIRVAGNLHLIKNPNPSRSTRPDILRVGRRRRIAMGKKSISQRLLKEVQVSSRVVEI